MPVSLPQVQDFERIVVQNLASSGRSISDRKSTVSAIGYARMLRPYFFSKL
ncbi:unknown protein [Microcystis aeruginosa NIES-843]|uniref:Uncharacterized protein n=1 Tax=Microcystis aeruginosa (strain NIES-843 / IAM M-2473) TaxID=449447 RepID=B0JQD5_MICAN|nr:unknown protein [Microcystis aeruginosa NIES-843]